MPQDSKERQLGQMIRYIPGSENGGAAKSLWAAFCSKNDGGQGNGQFKNADVNKDLVSLSGPGKVIKNEGDDKKTTTSTQYEAQYTRAVIEIKFPHDWPQKAGAKNNWGLEENPCWPQDIVPNDPGYVLLTNDNWYTTRMPSEDLRKSYSKRPPADVKAKADKLQGQKRPASPNDSGSNKQPKAKPPSAPSKRALEYIEDGFAIRDVNLTRRLTEEEMKRDVEIIQCTDRTCSKERRALGDEDGVLVIPGEAPPMTPPTNVDTVPTILPRARTLEAKVDKRKMASPEFPAATAVVT